MRKFLVVCAVMGSVLSGQCQAQWGALGEVNGRYGDYLRGGGVQMWAPLYQDGRSLLFVQGGVGDYAHALGTHIGVGYRALACPGVAWGVNAFADYAYSDWKRMFQQYGVGAELMSGCWVLRANGYAAVHNPKEVGSEEQFVFCRTSEQQITVCSSIRLRLLQAYSGTDVEAGYRLGTRCGELWGFVGYYYFGAHRVKNFHGPRVRAELRCCELPCLWGSQFVIGGEYHYDRRHKSQGDFELTLRMPLGRSGCRVPLCGPTVCSRMAEPVRRMPIIVTERDTERRRQLIERDFATIFFINGVPEATGVEPLLGVGTQQQPASLANAQLIAGPQDIVIGLTGNGATFAVAAPLLTKTEQQWGSFNGAPSITVTLPGGAQAIIPNLTGSGRVTFAGAAADVFPLVEGVRVFEVDIQGGARAIQSSGTTNVRVDNVNISGTTGNGIELTNTTGATITGTTISTAGVDGVVITGGSNATLTGVTVTDPTTTGISLTNNAGASFTGVAVNVTAGAPTALSITGQSGALTSATSTITQAGGGASVLVDGASSSVDLSGFTINNTAPTVTPVTVQNSTAGSVQLNNVTVTNTSAANAGLISNNVGTVSLTGFASTATAGGTLALTGGAGAVSIANSSVAAVNAPAVAATNSVVDAAGWAFTNVSSTNSASNAISLTGVTGAGTISMPNFTASGATTAAVSVDGGSPIVTMGTAGVTATATITGGAAGAFNIINGAPTFNYFGAVTNPAGTLANVNGLTGGSVTLDGREAGASQALAQTSGGGIVNNNSAAALTIQGAALTTPTGVGITLSPSTGAVTVSNSAISGTVANAITGTAQSGAVTVTGNTFTTIGANAVSLGDQRGLTTITGNTFTSVTGIATLINHADAGTLTATVSTNTEGPGAANTNATYRFEETNIAGPFTITGLTGNTGTRTTALSGIVFDNSGTMTIPNVTPATTLTGVNAANPVGVGGMGVGAGNDPAGTVPIAP